jgi:hypothetical protein
MLALGCSAGIAHASFHTFQIDEIYSSSDGSIQFIELHEAGGFNGQQFLAGHTLTSTQGVTTRTFVFAANLPDGLTAGKRVLIATPGFAALGVVSPDYIVPGPFLFPSGGTIDYAGVDSFTYPALPKDGVGSLGRSGTTGKNSPTNYAGQTGSISVGPPAPVTVAEIPTLGPRLLVLLTVLVVATLILGLRLR